MSSEVKYLVVMLDKQAELEGKYRGKNEEGSECSLPVQERNRKALGSSFAGYIWRLLDRLLPMIALFGGVPWCVTIHEIITS